MSASVSKIIKVVDRIAPFELAFKDDNVGLQVGDEKARVTRVLLTLDVASQVIKETIKKKAELVISHHPLIYQSLSNVVSSSSVGKKVVELAKNNVSLIVAHTNLDRVQGGVSDVLAQALKLSNVRPLSQLQDCSLYKVVVFVPKSHLEKVSTAMTERGAGVIGNYTHCTWRVKGCGTFKPGRGAKPMLGEAGKLSTVDEVRLEMTTRGKNLQDVIAAMVKVHPYEQVAYDIYRLENLSSCGFGRVGTLSKPLYFKEFVSLVKRKLNVTSLRYLGNRGKKVTQVAVCGGSGSSLVRVAKEAGADVLVSGDIKYHAALEACELGLAVIDAGHGGTERLVLPKFATDLRKEFKKERLKVTVLTSKANTEPWN